MKHRELSNVLYSDATTSEYLSNTPVELKQMAKTEGGKTTELILSNKKNYFKNSLKK